MKDFLKRALSDNGQPSSKRIMAFCSGVFFVVIMCFILAYLAAFSTEVTAIERNLVTLLTAAASLPAVLQGMTLFQKTENKGE